MRVVLAALAIVLGWSGCRAEARPLCWAGDHQACACAGGAAGYQACLEAEERFGACVCDGTTPGLDGSFEAAAPEAGPPGVPGKAALFASCGRPDDCASGVCRDYPAKGGSLCTRGCTGDADCAAPSPGCNMQGFCKAP